MNATDLKKNELPSSVSGSVLKEIMKAIPVLSAFVSIADNYFMTYNTITWLMRCTIAHCLLFYLL